MAEKVPCSEDTIRYNRGLGGQIAMDLWKGNDIPISSTLASGMVPLLTYAVRLLLKKEVLDPKRISPGIDI